MNKLCVALIGLMIHTSPLWAQTAVQQTGAVTDNSPVMWATDHHIRQAAGSSGGVAGRMITGGFSAVGKVCSYSNTTDQSGIALCLDAASSSLTYNNVAYPIAGGGGNVVGPVPTTVNDFALWNNTTGTLLKNAAGVIAAHTGGVTFTDTTTPTSYVADLNPGFAAYVWKTPNLIQLDDTSSHAGEVHATMAILNTSTGSTNGTANADLALSLSCKKRNWLTTAVIGEQGCLFAHLDQGAKGDSAVYLGSNSHVDDPASPNYGLTVFEAASFHVRPTSGT